MLWFEYKNSLLASVMSVVAGLFGFAGLFLTNVAGRKGTLCGVVGVVLMLVCVVGQIWAYRISKNIDLQGKLETKALDYHIGSSKADAVAFYHAYPGKQTLKYIRSLNPDAADQIEQNLAAQKKQKK